MRNSEEDLAVILNAFRLEGEDVIRLSTGKPLRQPRPGERMNVSVGGKGSRRQFKLYRIKFALRHGWLPTTVDHADRRVGNDHLSNLRPASQTQQNWNQGPKRKRSGLPVGVHRNRSRFVAQVSVAGHSQHIGIFDTVAEAEEAYQTYCREHRGEFYAAL